MANVKHYKKIRLLPKGYTECEYLESTGTQYLLIPFDANKRCTEFSIKAQVIVNSPQYTLVGVWTDTANANGINLDFYNPGKYRFWLGDRSSNMIGLINYLTLNEEFEINYDDASETLLVNGEGISYKSAEPTTIYPLDYICVFGVYRVSTNAFGRITQARIMSVRLTSGSSINLIPALDPSGRPCMFDTVSQTPFYNQGTGEFLYKIAEKPTMKLIPMVQMYHKGVPYFKEKKKNPWDRYIQDGLVFQLDCQTECSAEKWTDIKGGVIFVGSGINMVDNVPYFNGNSFYSASSKLDISNIKTVEIAYSRKSSNEYRILLNFGYTQHAIFYGDNINGDLYYLNGNTVRSFVSKVDFDLYNKLTTCSFGTSQDILARSKNYTSYRSSSWNGMDNNGLIGFYTSERQSFVGEIYSIRFYDRILTEEEMIANQQIDMERFESGAIQPIAEDTTGIVGLYSKGEVVRDAAGLETPQWMKDAVAEYGIPLENLKKAVSEFEDVKWCFMEGKTPMLNNNGKAYIKTDRKVTVSEGFYADFIIQYAEIDKHFISLNSAPRFYIGHMSQDDTRLSLAITSHHYTKTKYELNKPHKVKANVCVGECWMDVDDVREVVFNNTDNFECQYPLSLFFQYSIPSASSASHVFVNIGEDKYRFVPFLKDGKYGMLDLMTMQFYGNANTEGEFTYSLE